MESWIQMIRNAIKSDAPMITSLLWEIFEDMELPLLHKISKNKLQEMVAEAVLEPAYRYSLDRGMVYEIDGEVAGIAFGYPSVDESSIDEPFKTILGKHGYDPTEELFTDRESLSNEWYIDSIVVKKDYRGLGIGSHLLENLNYRALEDGYHTIGLNVDIDNTQAKKLYSKIGFKKITDIMISGHQYDHMCKTLSN